MRRLAIAAIILPVLFGYIYFLPPFPYFLALLLIVSALALGEFYVMYRVSQKLYIPGIIIGSILFYVSCRYPAYFIDGVFIGLFFLLLLRLIASGTPSGCMAEIGPLGVGFFYVSGLLSFLWFLRTGSLGREYIFLLLSSVWAADSAAYYTGTYIGRHKLYPAVSPAKTIEGAFGSIAGGSIGALIMKFLFSITDLTIMSAVVIGAILGSVTVMGDLIESMFKRDAGIKDSSNLIPGHGGMLDKIDGMLVAGPVLYFILRYV